jgi:hypothetical protein
MLAVAQMLLGFRSPGEGRTARPTYRRLAEVKAD